MRKLFVGLAAVLGGTFVVAAAASAQPRVAGSASTPRSPVVVLTSDVVQTAVASVTTVQAPLPRYTVRAGDTLSGIGARTARTWEQLGSYNHIPNANLIYVDQVLTIPPASFDPGSYSLPAAAPSYTPPPAPRYTSTTSSTRTYTPQRTYVQSAPRPSYYGGGSGGGSFTGIWACIAQHESGGNPATNTGNGYYGGLQFTLGTWAANGGTGNPANASAAEQQRVAENVVAASGGSYGAWPNTSRMCGV